MYGGRGGAKTVSISKTLLLAGGEESLRILCLREYMKSIKQSVHASLRREVGLMSMGAMYDCKETYIRGVNGTQFFYDGLTNSATALKSYDDIDIAWVEEAETVSQRSLDNLIPTIRKGGSELWFSFNPDDEFGPVYSRFVKPYLKEIKSKGFYEDDQHYICLINLEDNPFAPVELLSDSAKMKRDNPRKWLWIYGGECYSDYEDSIIKPEWFDAAIDAHIELGFKPLGVKSAGLDLADTGDDKALMGRHGVVVTHGKRWGHGELPDAIDIAFQKCVEWQSKVMMYDEVGLGKSMKVHLNKTADGEKIEVIPYNAGSRPRNPDQIYNPEDAPEYRQTNADYFFNARAKDYWDLRDRFEATYNAMNSGIYTDPDKLISISSKIDDIDVLKSELIKIKRQHRNNTKVQIQSKKDAAKEGIKSPNMADALKMCFANPSPKINKPVNLVFESEF